MQHFVSKSISDQALGAAAAAMTNSAGILKALPNRHLSIEFI
jgi:AraC-like DNA-binding protein